MGKKKNKKPKGAQRGFDPAPVKEPRSAPTGSSMGLNPSWRLSLLELADPYGWHTLDLSTATKVRDKLKSFESMTWSQILIGDKKHNHQVKVEDLAADAQKRLRRIGQDDVDGLVSLSLGGPARVWGILEVGVLKVIWWDPDHSVCPSHKKHT